MDARYCARMAKQIPLTKGKFALVDDEDFEFLSQWKWQCDVGGYAVRTEWKNGKTSAIFRMHRCVIGAKDGEICDHINRDRLDNRRENLRLASGQENARNCGKRGTLLTSKYKGVTFLPRKQLAPWRAAITIGGTAKYIGYYRNEIDAARAYDSVARVEFGEFASLNFPDLPSVPVKRRGTISSPAIGSTNTSGYKGVSLQKKAVQKGYTKTWLAYIVTNSRQVSLGMHETPEQAARAYDAKARELLGSRAFLNFPNEIIAVVEKKRNRTGFRGVFMRKTISGKNVWYSQCSGGGKKRVHVGVYESSEDAARAYDAKARELLGPRAILNFPD